MRKAWLIWIAVVLTGCGSLGTETMMGAKPRMLDTAPKSEGDLLYPEWGIEHTDMSAGVQGPYGQMRTQVYSSLQKFLLSNGIEHEVLPGNHVMVKLTDTIRFKTGSSNVSPDSQYWLNVMGQFLASEPNIDIVIDGHADSVGSSSLNDSLSLKRANAVKQTLMNNRVQKDNIYTRGYGEYVPACNNNTQSGKACNRRVEVLFIVSKN